MTYRFKPIQELYWGVLTALALVALPTLLTLDPATISDWRTWFVALGGALIRAAAGAALDYVRRSMADPHSEMVVAIESLSPEARQRLVDDLEMRRRERVGMV